MIDLDKIAAEIDAAMSEDDLLAPWTPTPITEDSP